MTSWKHPDGGIQNMFRGHQMSTESIYPEMRIAGGDGKLWQWKFMIQALFFFDCELHLQCCF